MNEEQLLKRKIIDTANQAFNHNIYTYTNFLSINELSYVNKMSNDYHLYHMMNGVAILYVNAK